MKGDDKLANIIQIKRGAFASLPTLAAGEFGFSTDTKQVHIGDGSANHELVTHDLFNANTFLYATSDNTPQVKTCAEVMALLSGNAAADFAMNTHKITGVTDPTADQDVATKNYVDAVLSGLDLHSSCRLATAAALPACTAAGSGVGKTLTGNANAVLTVDGVATVLDDRILVKDQGTGTDNGIYKVTTEGTAGVAFVLTRATDFDADAEVTAGAFTFIEEGTANEDEGWILITNDIITVDTTSLTFTQFASATAPVSTFVGLSDTPVNYSGSGLYIPRVNTGETGIEFVAFAATYLDDTAHGTNDEVTKAPTSNVLYDHDHAATGVHNAGANTLLHSASTIDGGSY